MRGADGRGVVLVVVLAVVLAGCGLVGGDDEQPESYGDPAERLTPSAVAPTDDARDPESPALARFYDQELAWTDCEGQARCARLEVPVDYAEPAGETIELELLKVPATGRRLAALVVNPGGPGASGVDYAKAAPQVFGAQVRRHFDVVGFDPRGVGRSAPVRCLPDEQLNAFLDLDPDPDTAEEQAGIRAGVRDLGRGCLRTSGDLAAHVSTEEVARDLDVLRAALEQGRLSYFGASYGTLIGATYADLFPDRVGRLVLDGALDPTLSTVELNLEQARGFETALRAYAADCVEGGDCPLGDDVDAAPRRLRDFLLEVEEQPLPAGERQLSVGNAVYGVFLPLYDEATWSILDTALQRALDGDGSLLMTLADAYLKRSRDGTYQDNSFQVFNAVNCLDHGDAALFDEVDDLLPRFAQASPTFGSYFAWSTATCSQWPVRSSKGGVQRRAPGAAPILVVGTTRDPATPYEWAQAMADQLESGVLVTRDGDGHTGYRRGNDCVDAAVEAYLVAGEVPEEDLTCE